MQELVVRCPFRGVITTNFDPGVLNARIAVRPQAMATGFCSWTDDVVLDQWRTGDIFRTDAELPVLFAHGHHNQPDAIVLATSDYRRAYGGKLGQVLHVLFDRSHIVWIGFSFADQRIAAILAEVAEASGTDSSPGMQPRHVAIMPWDVTPIGRAEPDAPTVLQRICEVQYGAHLILYPAWGHDHSALVRLLGDLAAAETSAPLFTTRGAPSRHRSRRSGTAATNDHAEKIHWVHGGIPPAHFVGRTDELARLDRWARDSQVRLIGVTAWGGAGKTGLVTQWLRTADAFRQRPAIGGLFAWSFYDDPSDETWARSLAKWGEDAFGLRREPGSLEHRVLSVLQRVPVVLLLDGLEVIQDGPGGTQFGRLLAGTLRRVLTGVCEGRHQGLTVLTSRFPFADLERFDGTTARMLDVPPLTSSEGAALLEQTGCGWLSPDRTRELVAAVDGHALALTALAPFSASRKG